MFQDLRVGLRMLLKNPSFTSVVVVTLALGIGANVALFSIVNGVLINPLPFPQPDQLVTIDQSKPGFETGAIPYPNFLDMKKENQTFSSMVISRGSEFTLIGTGEAERVSGRVVSADLFSLLGVNPALGRTFGSGEDEIGAAPMVVISTGLWQRKFAGTEDVLGKSVTLDDKTYAIVGVLPASFTLFPEVDVYVPIGQLNNPMLRNRGAGWSLHGIGRLKPGVTIEQGQADLNGVMSRLAAVFPDTNRGNGAKVSSLKERTVGNIGPTLWMLLGAVGFVLLIACVNISNLLLARSTARTHEFAIRAALGAGRWRLVRQTLAESLLLALVGGGLGLIVATWATHAALRALPTTLPRAAEVVVDARVAIFAVAISLVTGILSGLAPALKAARRDLSGTLKEGGRGASNARGRAQSVLVALEMALALILLIGAGLMIRSLSALWKVDPGFRSDNVLAFELSLAPSANTANPQATRAALREISDQLGSTPGIQAVSISTGSIPLQNGADQFFWVYGRPKPSNQSEMSQALVYRVEPGYLKAMGIPLKRGRFFTDQDDERSEPVTVIDEVLARKYFGDADPIGQRIQQTGQDPRQIVGVVGHMKQWSLDEDENASLEAQLYIPFRALADPAMPSDVRVVARSDGPAPFDSIRHVIQSQNERNVISKPQTMNEVIAASLAERRFSMILLDVFAVLALLLASIGLYGVISYLVGHRTHELGIRLALGAQRGDVLRLVLNDGMKMALSGLAIGLISALGLTRLLGRMLYGVTTTDPLTFAVISLGLTTVAFLACFIPARRATKVDPLVALRNE